MDTATRDEVLREVLDGFNANDLGAILQHFTDDATFDAPRGPDRWGTRYTGKDAIARGLRARFEGIPDVRYDEDRHFVSGDRGVSEWRLRGTTVEGDVIDVQGCDLWEF
ncbi:MAG: nuclear transport factor 2 family protein, partial [Actinomycetota bacterium]